MNGSSAYGIDYPLPGGGAAVYNASGLQFFRHAGALGSAALTTNLSRALLSSDYYAPFGFDESGAGAGCRSFTGQKQDSDSLHSGGQYDFLRREYNPIQGRWWTPDPAGAAAVDPNNPQTWNEYAYVAGMPLEATDPLGLHTPDPCTANGDGTYTCTATSTACSWWAFWCWMGGGSSSGSSPADPLPLPQPGPSVSSSGAAGAAGLPRTPAGRPARPQITALRRTCFNAARKRPRVYAQRLDSITFPDSAVAWEVSSPMPSVPMCSAQPQT